MSDKPESKSTATPEQIASFDALLAGLSAVEAQAVRRTWRAAQGFGYKTASKRVFANIAAPEPLAIAPEAAAA